MTDMIMKACAAADTAAKYLRGADDIVILTHRRPDGDTSGSAAALCLALRELGKRAFVYPNDDVTPRYAFLYAGLLMPEGFEPASIVSVDVPGEKLLCENMRERFAGKVDLAIDHHASHDTFARISCVDPSAAAAGEIVFAVMERLGITMTREMADAIYTAISTDTGCFRYSNTRAETHRIAAETLRAGANSADICFEMFEKMSRGRFELMRLMAEKLRFFADGKIVIAAISRAMIDEAGAGDDDIDGVSSIPRRIEGAQVGITVKESPNGGCRVSIRTDEHADATNIAGRFGGGGHMRASGCSINLPLDEAAEALAKVAWECIEN